MSYATRYGGHIPKALYHFKPIRNDDEIILICEFGHNCIYQRTTHVQPMEYLGIGTQPPGQGPFQVYHRKKGVIPNYGGHVPGEKLEFGKTFGNTTINAKRWLHE